MNSKHIQTSVVHVHAPQLSDMRYQRTADEHMRRPVGLKVKVTSDLSETLIQNADADVVMDEITGKQKLVVSIGNETAEIVLPYEIIESSTKAFYARGVLSFSFDVVRGGELEHEKEAPFQSVVDINSSVTESTTSEEEEEEKEEEEEEKNNKQETSDKNSCVSTDEDIKNTEKPRITKENPQPSSSPDTENQPKLVQRQDGTWEAAGVPIVSPFPFAFHI